MPVCCIQGVTDIFLIAKPIRKSLMFWLAMMIADSFFRTRFMAFRIYSMEVRLVKYIYSSSMAAAVFPLPRSWLDIKESSFLCVQVLPLLVVGHEFFLAQLIEVLHDGEIRRLFGAVVRAVGNAEPGIQLGQQDLNGIDLHIREIFIPQ